MFLMISDLSVQGLLSACFSCKLHKCYFSLSLIDDMNIRNTFLIFQQAIAERKPVQKPVAFTVEVPRPGRVERQPAPTNSNNSSSQSTNSSSSSRLTLTNSSSSSRLTNSGSSSRLAKQPCQVSWLLWCSDSTIYEAKIIYWKILRRCRMGGGRAVAEQMFSLRAEARLTENRGPCLYARWPCPSNIQYCTYISRNWVGIRIIKVKKKDLPI